MTKYYKFADIVIQLDMPDELKIPDNMAKFEIPSGENISAFYRLVCVDYHAIKRIISNHAEQFPHLELKALQTHLQNAEKSVRKNMVIYTKDGLECRWISFEGDTKPYAICQEISETETIVYIMKDQQHMFIYDTIFASVLAFERRALKHQSLLLHCAYMVLNEEAILFSAPSGTGKTTQAELWAKYRQTRQINGDAALLNKKSSHWMANGWTVCGSSEICHNETYPVRAIVMLSQAKENSCRKLSPMEAFKHLYPQIKVNSWNADAQNQAFELMDDLIGQVPVLELNCDISEDAVTCLEQFLETL